MLQAPAVVIVNLLSEATAQGVGIVAYGANSSKTLQAELSGAGANATVAIEGSNSGAGFVNLGTITLTSAAPCDGFFHDAPWAFVRARVVSISGAGASVTASMGS